MEELEKREVIKRKRKITSCEYLLEAAIRRLLHSLSFRRVSLDKICYISYLKKTYKIRIIAEPIPESKRKKAEKRGMIFKVCKFIFS